MGIDCIICGAQLKVIITGGEFLIREGSIEDNINFEKAQKIDFSKGEKLDEDVMLEVVVECSANPTHSIFAHIDSKIRAEIYHRIATAAIELRNKYHNPS